MTLQLLVGSKELLLEQKVPATYLALEDVVSHVAAERRMNGLDPVLNAEQYRTIVTTEMQQRFNRVFRDWAELHQATLFLHDNGTRLFLCFCFKTINTCRSATSLRRRYFERPLFPGSSVAVRHVGSCCYHSRDKSVCAHRCYEIRRSEAHF
jgi:hypothetical protein